MLIYFYYFALDIPCVPLICAHQITKVGPPIYVAVGVMKRQQQPNKNTQDKNFMSAWRGGTPPGYISNFEFFTKAHKGSHGMWGNVNLSIFSIYSNHTNLHSQFHWRCIREPRTNGINLVKENSIAPNTSNNQQCFSVILRFITPLNRWEPRCSVSDPFPPQQPPFYLLTSMPSCFLLGFFLFFQLLPASGGDGWGNWRVT